MCIDSTYINMPIILLYQYTGRCTQFGSRDKQFYQKLFIWNQILYFDFWFVHYSVEHSTDFKLIVQFVEIQNRKVVLSFNLYFFSSSQIFTFSDRILIHLIHPTIFFVAP